MSLNGPFRVLTPVEKNLWGQGHYLDSDIVKERKRKILREYKVPKVDEIVGKMWFSRAEYVDFLRSTFRDPEGDSKKGTPSGTDKANRMNSSNRNRKKDTTRTFDPLDIFSILRFVSLQEDLTRRYSTTTTRGIQVEVTTKHIGVDQNSAVQMSDVAGTDSMFVFAYNIRITNVGEELVKLVGRHWIIEDSNGNRTEVPKGSPGVVGYTPCLYPGSIFEYGSGLHLRTNSGVMSGSFQMSRHDGRLFDAVVRPVVFEEG